MTDWLREKKVPGGALVVAGVASRLAGLSAAGLWVSAWGVVLTLAHEEARIVVREKAAFDLGRAIGAQENVSRL